MERPMNPTKLGRTVIVGAYLVLCIPIALLALCLYEPGGQK